MNLQVLPYSTLSANVVLIEGKHPLLLDSGFVGEKPRTLAWLKSFLEPHTLQAVINSHWHSDHVGGNGALQASGVPVWAHRDEQSYLCQPEWLQHPSYNFTANRFLQPGETLSTGDVQLQVIHTPGHSDGHCSFYLPEQKILLWGDLVIFGKDIAWLRDIPSLQNMMQSFETLLHYPAVQALSGHGDWMTEPHTVLRSGLKKLEAWHKQPENMYWHAMKRIFVYHVMIEGQVTDAELAHYFDQSLWLNYFSDKLGAKPKDVSQELVKHLQGSGILAVSGEKIYTA